MIITDGILVAMRTSFSMRRRSMYQRKVAFFLLFLSFAMYTSAYLKKFLKWLMQIIVM